MKKHRLSAGFPRPVAQRGFSIIELMIGLMLGMFAVLIILQLLTTTNTQQRVASTSSDAQINAATATHILNREVAQVGMGISAYTLLGCSVGYTTATDGASITLPALGPVTVNAASSVVPPGDANTDTLLVISGSSAGASEGDAITAVSTATTYVVTTPTTFAVGDRVVAAPTTRDSSTACALSLGRVTSVAGYTLTVSGGTASLPVGSAVYNLGSAPAVRAYAVRNGNLTVCDYIAHHCGNTAYTSPLNSDVWVPIATNIPSLRAQYGRDTSSVAMDGVVDAYDQITPASTADTSGLPVYCSWLRVIGLRMVLVARSQDYDKEKPTAAAPLWSGSTANTSTSSVLTTLTPTAAPIDLSAYGEWQYHRYKTVETTIALRNVIWNGNQMTYQNGSLAC
ncbi:MAG: hypothetical protein EOO31_04265 [Comamonadaceae bacterium]|nr:MAG: hypothetical protein EOO31_04265 [Comamonadaceae bacterium]